MTPNESEVTIAVCAIRTMKWCVAGKSDNLKVVCAFPPIAKVIVAVVSHIVENYRLSPSQQFELPGLALAYVAGIIKRHKCESPAEVVDKLSRSLRYAVEQYYSDRQPRNEALLPAVREINKLERRARRAGVELSTKSMSEFFGIDADDIAEYRAARGVYYMKTGLREKLVKRVDGTYMQDRERVGKRKASESVDRENSTRKTRLDRSNLENARRRRTS